MIRLRSSASVDFVFIPPPRVSVDEVLREQELRSEFRLKACAPWGDMYLVDEQIIRWRHVALKVENGKPLFSRESANFVVEDHHVATEPEESRKRRAIEEVPERGLAEDALCLWPVQAVPVRQRAKDDALAAASAQHGD